MQGSSVDFLEKRIPDKIHHIHILGICGTGMAALAGMLKASQYHITGSDENVYPPMSDFLKENGIPVMEGYSPDNLKEKPDLVIIGNVIRAINPEARQVVSLNIPYVSMPQALGHFFIKNHQSLVVAGTHGKTTTSSLLATVLNSIGVPPGFMIGGIVEAFGRNFNLGKSDYFVVEGDEYDTAYFDKVSKFLHYRPKHAILTSIEFDHADIFANLDEIKASFEKFVALIPKSGSLVAYYDDPVVWDIAKQVKCPVITYGMDQNCSFRIGTIETEGLATLFTLYKDGSLLGEFRLPMAGRHNVLNCTAVIALLDHLGFDYDKIYSAIQTFTGVKRRQQIRGEVNNILVIDDFAHHPTAVKETINALHHAWPDRRHVVVFEPRTNSSRRAIFQQQYVNSFQKADITVLREHVPLENVPLSEQFSSCKLSDDLNALGKESYYFPDTDEILRFLGSSLRSGDVVTILSNGGFDNIHDRLLQLLKKIEGGETLTC